VDFLIRPAVWTAMALLSIAAAQPLTMISEVGKLMTTVRSVEGSYPIYEYESVGFEGDLPAKDYRAALDVVVRTTEETGCGAFADCGRGRLFILERIDGKLRVHSIASWIA